MYFIVLQVSFCQKARKLRRFGKVCIILVWHGSIDAIWTDAYSEAAYNTLKNRFSSLKWADSYGVPEKKGTFSADFNTGQKAIYLYYKGKSQEYREVYYKIYLSGENVVTEKGTGF